MRLGRRALVQQGPGHAGGAFRTKDEGRVGVVERIHFFRHDVGGGTQGTVKQGPVVKGRGFDFRDAMLFYRGLKKSFQVPPFAVGGVEGVVGAAWGVEGGGWGFGGEESTKEGVKGVPTHV